MCWPNQDSHYDHRDRQYLLQMKLPQNIDRSITFQSEVLDFIV